MIRTIVSLAVSVAFAAGAQAALKDGTYTSEVLGHNSPMTLKVTIQNGKIAKIDSSANMETRGVGRYALDKLGNEVIKHQSVGVDNVTGASVTSFAFLGGVKNALKQAGATPEELKALSKKVDMVSAKPLTIKASVAIVGGGGAGLAAAMSALENGAQKVVILEKLGYLGGSTQVSGGALNAVDDKRQKAQGIKDSIQTHYESTIKGGHNVGEPALVHYLTDNAYPTVEWMEKQGVKFRDKIGAATGSLGQRSHYGVEGSGWAYTHIFEEQLKAKFGDKIEILTDTPVTELLVKDNHIVGVKALRKGKQVVTVDAPSVVLATGGFGANVEYRQKVNTGVWKDVVLDKNIGTTNIGKAAQGDGLQLAEKIGADVIGLSDIQLHPAGTPGTGLMQDIITDGRNRLFVNTNGDRFVSEGAPRDTLCKAIFAQPNKSYWLVMNKLRFPEESRTNSFGVPMSDMLKLGRVKKANNLEELAKLMNVPYDHLKASVDEYNKAIENKGKPDKYGFIATNTDDAKMVEGPWYACLKVPTVHHTMGGVHINTNAQVLGKDGKPIKGLYAAGEVTGGIHGANRLGGNAIADVFTFGRQAGASAAKNM